MLRSSSCHDILCVNLRRLCLHSLFRALLDQQVGSDNLEDGPVKLVERHMLGP